MIPHVTGEVKRKLRELAIRGDGKRPADVVFVEVGGTVGDYENGFYIEALRELAFEEGPGLVCFVALTYVIEPQGAGRAEVQGGAAGHQAADGGGHPAAHHRVPGENPVRRR
jgi:CTP synthase